MDRDAMAKALAKDPEWDYGEVVPIATRAPRAGETYGAISLAWPDFIREPMQSWVKLRDSGFSDFATSEGSAEALPDVLNVAAMMAPTGMLRGGWANPNKRLVQETHKAYDDQVDWALIHDLERQIQQVKPRAEAEEFAMEAAQSRRPPGMPSFESQGYVKSPTHSGNASVHEASAYLAAIISALQNEDRR